MEVYRIAPGTNLYNAKVLCIPFDADKNIVFAYSYSWDSLKYAIIEKVDDLRAGIMVSLPKLKEFGISGPTYIKEERELPIEEPNFKLEDRLEIPAEQRKRIEASLQDFDIKQIGIEAAKLYWLRECPEVRALKWKPKWLRPKPTKSEIKEEMPSMGLSFIRI